MEYWVLTTLEEIVFKAVLENFRCVITNQKYLPSYGMLLTGQEGRKSKLLKANNGIYWLLLLKRSEVALALVRASTGSLLRQSKLHPLALRCEYVSFRLKLVVLTSKKMQWFQTTHILTIMSTRRKIIFLCLLPRGEERFSPKALKYSWNLIVFLLC